MLCGVTGGEKKIAELFLPSIASFWKLHRVQQKFVLFTLLPLCILVEAVKREGENVNLFICTWKPSDVPCWEHLFESEGKGGSETVEYFFCPKFIKILHFPIFCYLARITNFSQTKGETFAERRTIFNCFSNDEMKIYVPSAALHVS